MMFGTWRVREGEVGSRRGCSVGVARELDGEIVKGVCLI